VPPEITAEARTIAAGMTLEEKCAQTMMVSFGLGPVVPLDFLKTLETVPVGAILLLGYNIAENAEGIAELTASLAAAARGAGAGIPAFIAVDHEGGTVYRLGRAGTRLPDASAAGAALAAGADPDLLAALYRNAADQLACLGISFNLAPVLEPLNAENREFLRHRSFSADPRVVSRAGGLVIDAMRDGGILAAGKHFPGSGDGDPHDGLPTFGFDLRETDPPQLLPFREAVSRHRLAAVMTSHVMAPSLDPERPVTLSRAVQTDYLRNVLGFRGMVLTDDINMKALAEGRDPGRTAAEAIGAGADMFMYLEKDITGVHRSLVRAAGDGGLGGERLDEAVVRILEAKIALGLVGWAAEKAAAGTEAGPKAPDGGRRTFSAAEFARLKEDGDRLLRRFRAFGKNPAGAPPGGASPGAAAAPVTAGPGGN